MVLDEFALGFITIKTRFVLFLTFWEGAPGQSDCIYLHPVTQTWLDDNLDLICHKGDNLGKK